MLNLKEAGSRRRVISVDKQRLTLSGSKIMISSLSSSLIKFYEARPSHEKEGEDIVHHRHLKKSRSARSLNLDYPVRVVNKELPHQVHNKRQSQQNRANEYGIPAWGYNKSQIRKMETLKKETQKPSKLQIKSNSLRVQVSKQKQNQDGNLKPQYSPYLNFTFGSSISVPR